MQAGNANSGAASGRRVTSDAAASFAGTADAAASFAGPAGWRVIAGSNRFQLTSDGGRAWRSDALPAAIPAVDVRDISSAPGEATVVAAVVRGIVKVAAQARPGASWSVTSMTPSWPKEHRIAGPPSFLALTEAPHGFVGLVAGLSIGMSSELVDFFTSANGGASFRRAMSENSLVWRSTAFRSARDGIAVEGPAATFLYYTIDGGAQWAKSAIPAVLRGAEFSNPLAIAGGFLVAATRPAGGGAGISGDEQGACEDPYMTGDCRRYDIAHQCQPRQPDDSLGGGRDQLLHGLQVRLQLVRAHAHDQRLGTNVVSAVIQMAASALT